MFIPSVYTMDEKKKDVSNALNKNLLGSDLTLSFLMAASANYRHDTVLRPFPPMYIESDGETKDYAQLVYYS